MSTRLIIKTAELTKGGILIRSMEVIDGLSGQPIRIAKLTPELMEYLKMIEIEIDDYMHVQEMKRKNPDFSKLIDTFKLCK